MNQHMTTLVNAYLDGILARDGEVELGAWIRSAPENAAEFAAMVRLHDRLQSVIGGMAADRQSDNRAVPSTTRVNPANLRRRWSFAGGLAIIAAIALIAVWWSSAATVSAATQLDRLIDLASDICDRTYIIRNLDGQSEQVRDRQPPIDKATLHVRKPDQYVLVRQYPDGRKFVTGSDGERSWAVPPDGLVRVSNDPLRFRGPVPGHQHGIPFVDLRSDLVQLRDAYTVTPMGRVPSGQSGLLAVKKSTEYRGPNRVELWFDPDTGVIRRMVFSGMPRARGGPGSLAVELVSQDKLQGEFFHHQAHHDADRTVVEEE
jgi:hypothetical protein